MRWQLEHHHDRFAKNIPIVLSYLSGMEKGTEKLEHQYGLFFPRCTKCGNKCNSVGASMDDIELWGLCGTCAQPIRNRRYKIEQDARESRSLLLAQRMLPPDIIKQINTHGYISITSNNTTYLLSYTGKIYNTATGKDYCIHPTNWAISNWDRVIQFYILLHQRPLFVEERAHKRPLELNKWIGANTLAKEVITR